MSCCHRGAFGRNLDAFVTSWIYEPATSLFDKAKVTVLGWMPRGTLMQLPIQIIAEAGCAYVASVAMTSALDATDTLARNNIPLYGALPLTLSIATPIIVLSGVLPVTQLVTNISIVAIPIVLGLYWYNHLEEGISKIIYIFANGIGEIVGGCFGLALTGADVPFSKYRRNMVKHATAGQIFDLCIVRANVLPLQICRGCLRGVVQAIAYNEKPLRDAITTTLRRPKRYGIIAPALLRTACKSLQKIDTSTIANDISSKLLPFFSTTNPMFIAVRNDIDHLLLDKLEALQANSEGYVNVLLKSLIEYGYLIGSDPILMGITELLSDLFNKNVPERELTGQIQVFEERLQKVISDDPDASIALKLIGNRFAWNPDNLNSLSKLISDLLQEKTESLIGKKIYSPNYLRFIEKMITIHVGHYARFALARAKVPEIANRMTSEEDGVLILMAQDIIFFAMLKPLLPKWVVTGIKTTSNLISTTVVGTVHALQGFKAKPPKSTLEELPEIVDDPVQDEPVLVQQPNSDDEDEPVLVQTPISDDEFVQVVNEAPTTSGQPPAKQSS